MGIQLGPLLETRAIKVEELSGQRIAIDGFNVLYQFLTSIRQADGSLLTDTEGRVTSHLSGILFRFFLLFLIARPIDQAKADFCPKHNPNRAFFSGLFANQILPTREVLKRSIGLRSALFLFLLIDRFFEPFVLLFQSEPDVGILVRRR